MATVSAKNYKHHKNTDDTDNVEICVYHRRKYIDTTRFSQLTKDSKIKALFVASVVYRKITSKHETE